MPIQCCEKRFLSLNIYQLLSQIVPSVMALCITAAQGPGSSSGKCALQKSVAGSLAGIHVSFYCASSLLSSPCIRALTTSIKIVVPGASLGMPSSHVLLRPHVGSLSSGGQLIARLEHVNLKAVAAVHAVPVPPWADAIAVYWCAHPALQPAVRRNLLHSTLSPFSGENDMTLQQKPPPGRCMRRAGT